MNFFHRFAWALALGKHAVIGLKEANASADPFEQFKIWYGDPAVQKGMFEPTAVSLATVNNSGTPSNRMVLLKSYSSKGFVIYTNYLSAKSRELSRHPKAALLFFWAEMARQVRITGRVRKVSAKESDAYFASRARGSQIGAWASKQSLVIASREILEEQVKFYEKKFQGLPVPRPAHWGGFELIPDVFEFWQGRTNRLHDRLRYRREKTSWIRERLSP